MIIYAICIILWSFHPDFHVQIKSAWKQWNYLFIQLIGDAKLSRSIPNWIRTFFIQLETEHTVPFQQWNCSGLMTSVSDTLESLDQSFPFAAEAFQWLIIALFKGCILFETNWSNYDVISEWKTTNDIVFILTSNWSVSFKFPQTQPMSLNVCS